MGIGRFGITRVSAASAKRTFAEGVTQPVFRNFMDAV